MNRLDITIVVPGLPFNGNSLKTGSLGGSETAGLYMAKNLALRGHFVKVFCESKDGGEVTMDDEGVEYYPMLSWSQYSKVPHDVCIVQRIPEFFASRINSKMNILWCHDLSLGRNAGSIKSVMWNVDKIMVLSQFMLDQYKQVTGLPDEQFLLTRNGIDTSISTAMVKGAPEVRNKKQLVFTARPERGMDVLLKDIMPVLLKIDPEITLAIAGYENSVPHLADFYRGCKALAKDLGEGVVTFHGALNKEQLHNLYRTSGVYVYPTPSKINATFAEISCITVMECQLAGLPIVASDRGALRETINFRAGTLIPGIPTSQAYLNEFVKAVFKYIDSQDEYDKASNAGRQHALMMLDWKHVAEHWEVEFLDMFKKFNNSTDRLIRHFWRQSDILMADWIAKSEGIRETPAVKEMLDPFLFCKTPEGMQEQYAKIGNTHNADFFEVIPRENRFAVFVDWIKQNKAGINSMLDYGCGLGGYAFFSAKEAGIAKTLGVDIDEKTVEIAARKSRGFDPSVNIEFKQGTHTELDDIVNGAQFDLGVMQEVLEHVPNPEEVIENVERQVKKGGWIYITVPFGPWEFSSYRTYPHRCHIWHYDTHDLRDMFSGKQDLDIKGFVHGESPELGDPLGWWIVTYRADHEKIGHIDIQRKKKIQRPRQSISASLIAGGETSEETLHWCLKSYRDLCDEVIIADCGMTEEAKRIANSYAPWVQVFPGVDPNVAGFEVARNTALAYCKLDWVLWIDTDEKLINARNIPKYLRENMFNGYGIRQHHFACDTSFSPDMPVRFIRTGIGLKFFGALHEHPELELNKGAGNVVVLTDAHIAHIGYLVEGVRQRRFMRNWPLLKLDQNRYPERLIQKHFMMRDNMVLVREALKMNGNKLDAQIKEHCEEVVALYQKHFLGKGHYLNADSLQYYSDALGILGIGFEAAFQVEADKMEAKPNGVSIYRFASKQDFVSELTRRAEEKVKAFDSEWF